MALFNKEQDKNVRPEPPKIQPQPAAQPPPPPAPAATATAPMTAMPAPAVRPAMPAAAATGAYLDSGSKVRGKLSFEGATKIDGQVDGEINARDSLTIGESAIVTAQIKAAAIIVAGK